MALLDVSHCTLGLDFRAKDIISTKTGHIKCPHILDGGRDLICLEFRAEESLDVRLVRRLTETNDGTRHNMVHLKRI